MIFRKQDLPSWDKVLEAVTDRLQVRLNHGAVIKLFTMKDGTEISSIKELEDGMM